jgi:hypothetical protein
MSSRFKTHFPQALPGSKEFPMVTFRKLFGKATQPRRKTGRQAQRSTRRPLLLEQFEERLVPTVVFDPQFPKESVASAGPYTVLNNPTVHLIFWGMTPGSLTVQNLTSEAQAVLSSGYFGGLNEYNNGNNDVPVYGGAWTDPNGPPAGYNVGGGRTTDIQARDAEVANAIQNNPSWAPSGTAITQSPIYVLIPVGPAAGYNNAGTYQASNNTTDTINECSVGTTNASGTIVPDFFTQTLSHELAELITDPGAGGVTVNYSTNASYPGYVNAQAPNVNNNPNQQGNLLYLNSGGQIGDGEQEPGSQAHYGYRVTGTDSAGNKLSVKVQSLWSNRRLDDTGNAGVFLVADGNLQNIYLDPIWTQKGTINLQNYTDANGNSGPNQTITAPTFTGTYDLLIRGDQFADPNNLASYNDVITVNADDTQVIVTISGETFTLGTLADTGGGQIKSITIEPGLGTNTVTIQKLASDQTVWVEDGSFAGTSGNISDTVTVGNNGDMSLVRGDVYVTGVNNPGAVTTLNVDDSKDLTGVGRTVTLFNPPPILPGVPNPFYAVSFSGLGGVYYFPSVLQALNVSGGMFGNTFNVLGTGGSLFTTINTGLNNDNVTIAGAQGPVTINGNGNNNQVTVGDPGIGVAAIAGNVEIDNNGGATKLTVDDAADPKTTPDTVNFVFAPFGQKALGGILGLQPGQNSIDYEQGALSSLTVKTPALNNTVNFGATLVPTYLISGGSRSGAGLIGNDTVTVGQTSSIAGFNGISGTVQGIQGDIYIENTPGVDTVVVDNSQDPTTGRQVTLSTWTPPSPAPAPLDDTDPFGRITGLAPGTINYELNDTGFDIVIRGGGQSSQPGNTWTVTGGSDGQTIRLFTGPGNDPVNLEATAGLFYLEGGFTSSSVTLTVGTPSGTGRTMQNIQGNVYDQEGIGSTAVVDDSADTNPVTATLSQVPDPTGTTNSVYERIQSLSQGDVYLPETDTSDTVLGGSPTSGTNVFTINGTLPETALVLQTGTGQDQVNVTQDEAGGLTINSHSARDTVTLGNAGSVQPLAGFAVVNGLQGTTNVVVDDSQDTSSQSAVTLTSATLDGLVSGASSPWLRYTGVAQLVVKGGTPASGGVTFTLSSLPPTTTQLVLQGKGAADTVVGPNLAGSAAPASTWTINAAGGGTLGSNVSFTGIGNVHGGTGGNVFQILPAGSLVSLTGSGSGDWLDYSALATGVTVNLATGSATAIGGGTAGALSNVQNVIGGAGSNSLTGSAQGNVLVGGPGNDALTAGSGRSLLIGGAGKDSLTGGAGDDILIAGTTTFGGNYGMLDTILATWQRTDLDYGGRITALEYNGAPALLWGSTVLDDGASDTLQAGSGRSWYFANLNTGTRDTILGRKAGEQLNNGDFGKALGLTASSGRSEGDAITTDGLGNVYWFGDFTGSCNVGGGTTLTTSSKEAFAVAKYTSGGAVLWADSFSGPGPGDNANADGAQVAVDGAGNVYVIGEFTGTMTLGGFTLTSLSGNNWGNTFVAKLSPTGTVLWARQFGNAQETGGIGIAVDGAGNVYTSGFFEGTVNFGGVSLTSPAGDLDMFLTKLDSSGNTVWAKHFGGTAYTDGFSIAVSGTGSVYVAGTFTGTVAFGSTKLTDAGGQGSGFVAKFTSTGSVAWARVVNSNQVFEEVFGLAVDPAGNVYAAGAFDGTITIGSTTLTSGSGFGAFVTKLNSSGAFQWATGFTGNPGFDEIYSLATDASGNVYADAGFEGTITVGGTSFTSAGGYDCYVAKLNTSGAVQWADQMGGPGDDEAFGVAVDGAGTIYTTGYFGSVAGGSSGASADFDAGPATYTLTSPSAQGSAYISELTQPGPLTVTGMTGVSTAGYTVRESGGYLQVVDTASNTVLMSKVLADTTALTITAAAGVSTTLTIDFSGGVFSSPVTFTGGSGSNTLVGANVPETWSITGANTGKVGNVSFSKVANLVGGSAADVFKFSAGGSLSGRLNGSGGGDWLDYSGLPATLPVTVNLVTGAATDVAGGVSNIQNVRGGPGNDTLTGGRGNILIGGAGSNRLIDAYAGSAAAGRSLLIGGAGSSNLTAGAAGDILIAGTTTFDANYAALQSILAEWQSADSYLLRFQRLEGLATGGLNGTNKLVWGSTVKDTDRASVLNGGAGLDWFFANYPGGDDVINNLNNPSKEHLNNTL